MSDLLKQLENAELDNLKYKKEHPVKYFLKIALPYFVSSLLRKLSWKIYEIKCIFKPYNVVRARSLQRTWVDRDHLLFHTSFQILVDFIEQEHPFHYSDFTPVEYERLEFFVEYKYGPNADTSEYGTDKDNIDSIVKWNKKVYPIYKEMVYLYKWYKDIYPNKPDVTDLYINKLITINEDCDITNEQLLIEDIMLHRLINIRHSMWT